MSEAPFGRGRTAARVLSVAIRWSVSVGARLPAWLTHGLARVGGNIEWAVRPGKRRLLAANLARAVAGDPSERGVRRLVRREIVNEAHRSADLLWALGKPQDFLAAASYEGLEYAQEASRNSGLIFAGVHVGGWEVATAVPGHVLDVSTAVVVADDWLAWGIERSRVSAGLRVMYPSTAGLSSLRHLSSGGALLILGDDPRFSTHLIEVELVGHKVRLAGGVAALSRLAQVPIVTFHVLPLGPRRWKVTVEPAIAPPAPDAGVAGEAAVLQQVADRWSDVIRSNPEHWAAVYEIPWSD